MNKGNKILLIVIIVTIFLSLYSIFLSNFLGSTGKVPQQTIRFLLTLMLTFFLYKGYNAARIILVVLYLIAGVIGFFVSIVSISRSPSVLMLLFPSLAYLICAAVLMIHPDVKRIFIKEKDVEPVEILK